MMNEPSQPQGNENIPPSCLRVDSGLPEWDISSPFHDENLLLSGQDLVEATPCQPVPSLDWTNLPSSGQAIPLQLRHDAITQPPSKTFQDRKYSAAILPVLINLRRDVQQELDNASLKGQIRLDCGSSSLDQNISGHFAAAIRHVSQSQSAEYASTMGKKDCLRRCHAFGAISTQSSNDSAQSGIGRSQVTPVFDLNPVDLVSPDEIPSHTASANDEVHRDDVVVSKRRKRMPKIPGAYPCDACGKIFDRAGDRTKHAHTVHQLDKRNKHHCRQCWKGFPYPKDLKRHMKQLHNNFGDPSLPITPSTVSPKEVASSSSGNMPGGICHDSYFPPVEEYWSSKSLTLAPPTALAPLLPTPVSPALPLPETLLNDLIRDEPEPSIPTCSCPVSDTCVVEALALLFGSVQLLAATRSYHQGNFNVANLISGLGDPLANIFRPKEVARFEPTLRKLIAPFVDEKDFDVAETLWKHWRCPQARGGTFADNTDLCGQLRESLETMLLDVVDTVAPMQHDIDTLLALYKYMDDVLQSKLEALQVGVNASRSECRVANILSRRRKRAQALAQNFCSKRMPSYRLSRSALRHRKSLRYSEACIGRWKTLLEGLTCFAFDVFLRIPLSDVLLQWKSRPEKFNFR